MQWLAGLPRGERCYFSCRDQSLTLAGVGVAIELKSSSPAGMPRVFAQAEELVKDTKALWLGGSSFSGRAGAYQWQGFPGARFVLPLIELRQEQGSFSLAFNLCADSFAQWQEQQLAIHSYCSLLAQVEAPGLKQTQIVSRHNSVDEELWQQQVDESLELISRGDLQKVVLAREVALELSECPNPMLVLAALEAANPECYSFAIELEGTCFMGCSPERLLKRRSAELKTEALAGTVRRGLSKTEDIALEKLLLEDPKLVHEHKLVAQAIQESLVPVTARLESSEPVKVLKLNRVQHRCQPLTAIIHPSVATSDLYSCIHPTPAICGFPSTKALALINDIEPICRGWYSGSVGVLGHAYCELSVAIRSALIIKNRLWLYSGVGIVEGSVAGEEWQELESKLESMLQAIGYKVFTKDCNVQ